MVTPPQRPSSDPPLPPVRSGTTPTSIVIIVILMMIVIIINNYRFVQDIENFTVSIATPPDVSQATPLTEEQSILLNNSGPVYYNYY